VRLSTEALLMLVAIALYLFDSSLLLAGNEAVLLRGRGGRWFARFGLDRWRLGGREPYLPNPLTPHFPLFKRGWRFDEASQAQALPSRLLSVPDELAPFGVPVLVSLVCIFVLLPVVLFYPQGVAFAIAVLAAFYVNIAVVLTLLFRRRATFALSPGEFAVLAFECVACPPFSINLIRKLCARLDSDEDFNHAAARLLPTEALPGVRAQCLRRIDEQIDYEQEDTPRMQALQSSRKRFTDAAPE
jgi:hypothetical protein